MPVVFKSIFPGGGFEITETTLTYEKGFGPFKKVTTVPLRNISSATIPSIRTNQIKIVLNSGEQISLTCTDAKTAIGVLLR